MNLEEEFHGSNLGFVLDLYDQYQNDPEAVDEPTRKFFEARKPDGLTGVDLQVLIGTINRAQAIRSHGYLAADVNLPPNNRANELPGQD
jgi:2-oxoglutarate dehydrogenase E1 component